MFNRWNNPFNHYSYKCLCNFFIYCAITKHIYVAVPLYYQDISLIGWNIIEVFIHDWRAQLALIVFIVVAALQISCLRVLARHEKRKVAKALILCSIAALLHFPAKKEIERIKNLRSSGGSPHLVTPTLSTFIMSWASGGSINLTVFPRHSIKQSQISPRSNDRQDDNQARRINLFFIQYESTFPTRPIDTRHHRAVCVGDYYTRAR